MQITIRELRSLIREYTRSITGYPFAPERDVTSQNPTFTMRSIKEEEPEGDWMSLGDNGDIFDGDDGLELDNDGEFPDATPLIDPYVHDATRRS